MGGKLARPAPLAINYPTGGLETFRPSVPCNRTHFHAQILFGRAIAKSIRNLSNNDCKPLKSFNS